MSYESSIFVLSENSKQAPVTLSCHVVSFYLEWIVSGPECGYVCIEAGT